MNRLLLKALNQESLATPPIWFMRQAGRYLSEYRDVRSSKSNFLDLCYSPHDAMEVTLQPIRRFGFDASIIFSDILVIPDALGADVQFIPGQGPVLSTYTSSKDINTLTIDNVVTYLEPVYEACRLTRAALPAETAFIGFAGSPWTVATYMIEGGSSKQFELSRTMAYKNTAQLDALIEILVEATILHLRAKIEAGCEVIQLFDSWAGVLSEQSFNDYVIAPNKAIVEALKTSHPHIPIIGFPKGAGSRYEQFVKEIPVDGVSIDFTVPLAFAKERLQPSVCVQGNLDPLLLAYNKDKALAQTDKILQMLGDGPFIFNLGHGIIPATPVDHVHAVLDHIRGEGVV